VSEFIDKIANYILEDEIFADFKFRKKDCCLIKKTPEKTLKVKLKNWSSHEDNALIIMPIYSVRFNVLHKWFEKFSKKSISDQRDNYTIGFDGEMLGKYNEYRLSPEKDFDSVINTLKEDVTSTAKSVFTKYARLDDLYESLILPVLNEQAEFPDIGADWIFKYLALAKLTHPTSYTNVKQTILQHTHKMHDRGEPNISLYYDNIHLILESLENEF